MVSDFPTKNVFIDTRYFYHKTFNVNSSVFRVFKELCNKGELCLHTTPITLEEIKSNIAEIAHKIAEHIHHIKRKAPQLGLIEAKLNDIKIGDLDKAKISSKMYEHIEIYFKECGAILLEFPEGAVRSVFEKYFKKEKPFGKGKKKSEFPDAFVLEALSRSFQSTKHPFFVVSGDPDFKGACDQEPGLIHKDSLEDVIGDYNEHEEALSEHIDEVVQANWAHIEGEVSAAFEGLGFYAYDVNGDIFNIDVSEVEFLDVNILDVDDQRAVVSASVTVHFTASAEFGSEEFGYFDDEDKVWVPLETVSRDLDENFDTEASFTLHFDKNVTSKCEIEELVVNDGKDVWLYVKED